MEQPQTGGTFCKGLVWLLDCTWGALGTHHHCLWMGMPSHRGSDGSIGLCAFLGHVSCTSAQHEPMGVNSGWSVLPVATEVAWKMLFCHSHHHSKRCCLQPPCISASPGSGCTFRKEMKRANHRSGEAPVTFTWEPFSGLQM